MTTNDLDARYGRTADRRARSRIIGWVAAFGVTAVMVAWVVWAGILSPGTSLQSRDVGFETLSDTSVKVSWQVTAPAGSEISCAVKAVSDKKAIVGWKVVEIAPSDEVIRTVSQVLRTTEPADGGLLYRCWLT